MAYSSESMYCKLFSSLYQGTLRGRSHAILVFTNLLAHADQYGIVDKHFRAIAEEVGLSIPEVKAAIEELESPDPESRSPVEEGRRIMRMDEHRVWGWQIVNYGKYRAIRNEDDRRVQNRESQKRWREKHKGESEPVSQDKPQSSQEEAKADAKEYSSDFLEFWKEYPRKVGKGDAWSAWKKIKNRPELSVILDRVAEDAQSEQWQTPRYIPHPSTWLNERRWEDEPPALIPETDEDRANRFLRPQGPRKDILKP